MLISYTFITVNGMSESSDYRNLIQGQDIENNECIKSRGGDRPSSPSIDPVSHADDYSDGGEGMNTVYTYYQLWKYLLPYPIKTGKFSGSLCRTKLNIFLAMNSSI